MKKDLVIPQYTDAEVRGAAETLITAEHKVLAMAEQRAGKKLYDTFGEWKQKHPNHPIAKKDYPNDEYLQIISAYRKYFDALAAEADELL